MRVSVGRCGGRRSGEKERQGRRGRRRVESNRTTLGVVMGYGYTTDDAGAFWVIFVAVMALTGVVSYFVKGRKGRRRRDS